LTRWRRQVGRRRMAVHDRIWWLNDDRRWGKAPACQVVEERPRRPARPDGDIHRVSRRARLRAVSLPASALIAGRATRPECGRGTWAARQDPSRAPCYGSLRGLARRISCAPYDLNPSTVAGIGRPCEPVSGFPLQKILDSLLEVREACAGRDAGRGGCEPTRTVRLPTATHQIHSAGEHLGESAKPLSDSGGGRSKHRASMGTATLGEDRRVGVEFGGVEL